MKLFQAKAYPEKGELYQLAKSLNTSLQRVGHWFTYMRHKKIAEGMFPEGK